MENDYNSEEGLSFLSYIGIRLSLEEEQVLGLNGIVIIKVHNHSRKTLLIVHF